MHSEFKFSTGGFTPAARDPVRFYIIKPVVPLAGGITVCAILMTS